MKLFALLFLMLQWGLSSCGPVGSSDYYSWQQHNARPGCWALYLNGRQVGFYDPAEGTYQRWHGGNQWSTEECPVALPVPPAEKPAKMPKPAEELIQQNFGVDLEKTKCDHEGGYFRYNGKRISKHEAIELIGADLPDFSNKLHVMVVGSPAERAAFLDQIRADTTDCVVQDCEPSHWWAMSGGYKPGVWVVKPQNSTYGTPVWYQADYNVSAFKQGLQAVRSPTPPDPDKIPGPNTPKPKPKPDDPKPTDGLTTAQWLGIAAAAVLAFLALTHRSQPDA